MQLQAGVIEEMMNDAVDNALDSEDIEEETEEEIDKVLTAIAGETAAQLPEAVRKEKLKQPATSEDVEESVDDEERARGDKGSSCQSSIITWSCFVAIINNTRL
ncbi:UNVERIFIED_CONTAM: Vacuolar protein sorting-associated protein [Sesamum angustifolium]|uniref:Vacuolar protein sorting-associated protein n=1 Tax=Sesamum angustifolium TaxID=2727405 RepID=A0AAW2QRC6_9LAMI